jgi:hypothetical protein
MRSDSEVMRRATAVGPAGGVVGVLVAVAVGGGGVGVDVGVTVRVAVVVDVNEAVDVGVAVARGGALPSPAQPALFSAIGKRSQAR